MLEFPLWVFFPFSPSTPDVLILSPPSHHLNCCHHILLLSTPCPCHILSCPTHGPGLHPSDEERPYGLCFNCGKPGHIMKVCQGPHTQNVWNVDAMMILRLPPKDLQFLAESLRAMVTLSVPTTPLAELEGKKTPGDKGF